MKKRLMALVLVSVLAGCMFMGCGSDNDAKTQSTAANSDKEENTKENSKEDSGEVDWSSMTIAWSPANLSNELQVTLTDSLTASFKDLGSEFLTSDPQGDAVTQVEQVENYISRGVDMILMSPTDAEACGVVVDEAKEAGIPLIIVNCMLNNIEDALCYVGCDDLDAGEILMEYAADSIGNKGSIAILRGPDGLDAQIKRTKGIENVLKENSEIKVESSQAADWKTDLAMTTVENWLQTMELNAVICENDEMAVGAVEAIVGQGYDCNEIKVFGIDGIPSAYASIASGEGMTATLLQNAEAIAIKTAEVVVAYFETGVVDAEYIIPWEVVDASNISSYHKE